MSYDDWREETQARLPKSQIYLELKTKCINDAAGPLTSTKLYLRKKNPWERMNEDEFIKSVENVLPNPPFKILIETASHNKVKDEHSFSDIKVDSLKDHTWAEYENIRVFNFEFEQPENGFTGSGTVALLESHGEPISNLEKTAHSVEIDGKSFELHKKVAMNGKNIRTSSTSISIDDDGGIRQSDPISILCNSISRLSFHGIEVPTTLFPNAWEIQNNQVKLDWLFPALLVIDVCGDLDLNSSRTQVIMSDKWTALEALISLQIFSSLANSVELNYWNKLKPILESGTKNQIFIDSLNKVQRKTDC